MRTWLSGRASPCQGEGRGFESRRPLGDISSGCQLEAWISTVEWPRGEAAACKAVHTGSNPVSTSQHSTTANFTWAIGAAVARFPDTEEVTGSIPVSPTSITAGQRPSRRNPRRSFCVGWRVRTPACTPAGSRRFPWTAVIVRANDLVGPHLEAGRVYHQCHHDELGA